MCIRVEKKLMIIRGSFMIIHVEKRKTRISRNYSWISHKLLMIIRVYSCVFVLKKINDNSWVIYDNSCWKKLFMLILLVASLCKSGRAERVYIYAYSCWKKSLCSFLFIYAHSCLFMLIHVENSTNLEHFRCRDVLEVLPVVRWQPESSVFLQGWTIRSPPYPHRPRDLGLPFAD